MRISTILVLAFFCHSFSLVAQDLNFSRTHGGINYDDARSVVPTDDGGFVFTGLNKSADDTEGDMYLTKINVAGAVLWERFYGLPEEDGGNFLMKTQDGGYIISGHTAFNYGSSCNGYIIKTDAEGTEEWRRFVGTAFDDVCNGAVQTADGDYYFTGRIEDQETGMYKAMICKISKDGTYRFMKNLGTVDEDYFGYRIVETKDENLLVVGHFINKDTKRENLFAIQCDKLGNQMWRFTPEYAGNTRVFGVLVLDDGSFVMTGGTAGDRNIQYPNSAFLLKINRADETSVYQTIDVGIGTNYGFDLCKNEQGEFIISGMVKTPESAVNQPAIIIANENFELVDYKLAPSSTESRAVSILGLSERDFLVVGRSKSESENYNILISRIIFNATTVSDPDLHKYSMFPNPMSDYTFIKMENAPERKTFNLYNAQGVLVRSEEYIGDELFFYKNNLPAGIYYFKVTVPTGGLLNVGSLLIK